MFSLRHYHSFQRFLGLWPQLGSLGGCLRPQREYNRWPSAYRATRLLSGNALLWCLRQGFWNTMSHPFCFHPTRRRPFRKRSHKGGSLLLLLGHEAVSGANKPISYTLDFSHQKSKRQLGDRDGHSPLQANGSFKI